MRACLSLNTKGIVLTVAVSTQAFILRWEFLRVVGCNQATIGRLARSGSHSNMPLVAVCIRAQLCNGKTVRPDRLLLVHVAGAWVFPGLKSTQRCTIAETISADPFKRVVVEREANTRQTALHLRRRGLKQLFCHGVQTNVSWSAVRVASAHSDKTRRSGTKRSGNSGLRKKEGASVYTLERPQAPAPLASGPRLVANISSYKLQSVGEFCGQKRNGIWQTANHACRARSPVAVRGVGTKADARSPCLADLALVSGGNAVVEAAMYA
ncbi:hypothetical protein QBC46DRAFT_420793 [Diplogelasinospora grovesii]|uniref:Uncharacterized protein n=1 Tax=Diplogelasinospora grovesii TaxID=303347 RepID=A0AAN6NCQ3_9PEZI|nr:hypothetical protein QBC46DRAFT_420793 [Diplogelasinospora grovesii]